MKPAIKTRPSANTPPLTHDTDPADLRDLLALIGQTPPELENWLFDRRPTDRDDGK